MKSRLLAFILILAIGSCMHDNSDNNVHRSMSTAHVDSESIIGDFYSEKYKYIKLPVNKENWQLHDSLDGILLLKWNEVLENKDAIISYLLTFENDSGYSLYMDERYLYSAFVGKAMPNYLHALYLIEGINSRDYLFNRREWKTYHNKFKFRNDGLNFIIDTTEIDCYSIEKQHVFSIKPDLEKHKDYIAEAWEVYKTWYRDGCKGHPLQSTSMIWYKAKYIHGVNSMNYRTDTFLRDLSN